MYVLSDMGRRTGWLALVVLGLLGLSGCLNVRAPDVQVNMGDSAEPVDSTRVPQTASHEEAQAELDKAYRYIQSLERQNRDLKHDRDELKHERDKYKKERDQARKRDKGD
jgi:hypothetical protein